jgi:hypothetical protein
MQHATRAAQPVFLNIGMDLSSKTAFLGLYYSVWYARSGRRTDRYQSNILFQYPSEAQAAMT